MEFWPEADRQMWVRLVEPGGLLLEAGVGARWAAETGRVTARDYGYWLSFVFATYAGAEREDPDDRLTAERVRAYCHSMAGLAALTRASRIARLYAVVQGSNDSRDLAWLTDLRRVLERLARREGPARPQRGRLVSSRRLFEAGLSFIEIAREDHRLSPRLQARRVRDGLMVALLAARPLRIELCRPAPPWARP